MSSIMNNLKTIFSLLTTTDLIFLGLIILLIIFLATLLFIFRNSDENLVWEDDNKPFNDNEDILKIAKALESCNEQLNIDLTPYETKEEEASIISYEELLDSYKTKSIAYSDELDGEVVVKKVDISNTINNDTKDTYVKPVVLSYEKEEALLTALKQLQENLSGL